jgi:hypothetical protein
VVNPLHYNWDHETTPIPAIGVVSGATLLLDRRAAQDFRNFSRVLRDPEAAMVHCFLTPRRRTKMRGFEEFRGHTTRIDFDAETGQFFSRPIAPGFAPLTEPNVVVQKLAELRKRRQKAKAKQALSKLLARMSPEARDDVGMTEVFAASNQN